MKPFDVADLTMICIVAWLLLLFALVAYRLLVGSIALGGLFSTRGSGIEADRVLLLASTLFAAAGYAVTALDALAADKVVHRLPEAPAELLTLFGVSSGTYVAGKIFRMLKDS